MATTIATSTFAQPIARAGSRAIIKLGNGNLLAVYHDGAVGFKSREASTEANLASATAVAIAASTDANDPISYCLWPDGVFLSIIGSTSGASSYQTYSAGAWTAHTAPGTFGNFTEISGFKSGTSFYFVSGGNFGSEFDNHYATSFGGAFTSLGQNNFANSQGVDGFGLVTLPWNSKSLVIGLDSGKNLQWYAKDTLAGVSGGNFQAVTSIETLGASAVYKNNLAGVVDSNGNAWMAYNDFTGIQLRMLTAAGAAWTAKTAVTAASGDAYPAMFQDTAGGVWVVWIDGGAANAIKAQKATVSAGAISLSGTVQTIVATTATRKYLTCIESDSANIHMVWTEGTGSPYNIVFHTYALSTTTTSNRTITPASAALQSTLSRTLSSNTGAIGNYVIRTITSVQAALQGTLTRTIGTVTANILPNINPVVIATADQQSQTRMGRPIVRDQNGVAVISITPTWLDATNFGPASFIYSSPSPYSTWTQRNSPGSGLSGLKLGEEDTSAHPVSNPSFYYDSVNNDIFGFGQNNQNDGLATHAYNDATFAYATAYNGTFTTNNFDTAQWANVAFTSVVMVPGTHNFWYANNVLPPGTTYGSSAANQTLAFRATTGEINTNWVGNGSVAATSTTEGPYASAAASVYLFPQMAYTAGSPATLYCFFNDTQGVLRYCSWSDAATPALPAGLNVSSTTFTSPVNTGSLSVTNEQFSIARDTSDGLHVVVKNGSGIQYTYKPLGGSWTTATTISAAANDGYPRVTCFGNTRAVVTWVQATGTANKQNIVYAYTSISSSPSFGSTLTIYSDAGTNNASYVNTEANSQDTTSFLVTWVQGTANPYSVYAAQVAPSFVTTISRTISSVTASLSPFRTMTPVTAALQGTRTRTINPATAALLSTLSRTATPVSAALQSTLIRTVTPATVALQSTLIRTITPTTVALQSLGLARTMTPNTVALQSTLSRTLTPATVALLGTLSRTMPATVNLQGSPNRTMTPVTGALQSLGLARTITPVTGALQSTLSRTMTPATVALQSLGLARTVTPVTAALLSTLARTMTPVTTALLSTLSRTITPATARLSGTFSRTTTGNSANLSTAGTFSRTITPATVALSGTFKRTITPATGALQSLGLARTMTPVTVALQSTLSRTMTPATVALLGTPSRTMTPATVALSGTFPRTISGTTANLQSNSLSRTMNPATVALQSLGLARTVTPATTALQSTLARTMASNSAALQSTLNRTMTPATVVLQGSPSRTMNPATAALQSLGLARTMTPATASIATLAQSRTIPSVSVALQSTLFRSLMPISVAVQSTLQRTLTPTTVSLAGSPSRNIPAAAALSGTSQRSMSVQVALQGGVARAFNATAALSGTLSRTLPTITAAVQGTLARSAAGTAALSSIGIARTITSVTAMIALTVPPVLVANETAVFTIPAQTAGMVVPSQTATFRIVG